MRFIDEFRDPALTLSLSESIAKITSQPWRIMEICGGQTHSILRFGLEQLLPPEITLIHGPGCPVCVTPLGFIDSALEIAAQPNVILCTFGDMIRVPGSKEDLMRVKARGADVRIVYSPFDAVRTAMAEPHKEVVFFAVGFETTAPATAMAVLLAHEQKLKNFSMLVSHVLVPPAIETLLRAPDHQIDGFLAAGHVCTVMGYDQYHQLAEKYHVPIIVAGFEPIDLLTAIHECVQMLESRKYIVVNQYKRSVQEKGNIQAQEAMEKVYMPTARKWRGLGEIPLSGLQLREKYQDFDALRRFTPKNHSLEEPRECIAGEILRGLKKPDSCPAFRTLCTPEHPLGAPMVSSEGACSAYHRYHHSPA